MSTRFKKSIFCIIILAVCLTAWPASAQLPAFKSRSTNMCLVDHHFTEQDLLLFSSQAYPDVKGSLTPGGEGFGYLALKMITHPNVGQGANLGFSLPSELGMSFQSKKMFGFTFPGSDTIGNALNGFGLVVIAGQLVDDIATDNPQLQINLAKNSAFWTIGYSKMFSKAMKISAIAVSIFDYTLNELGNAALNGQKHMWYTAYANYFDTEYGHHVKDMPKWDRLIEKHGGNMGTALKEMHKEFWDAPFRDSYKKQKYIWSNADLGEKAKIEVRDTYLKGMLPVLTNYYWAQQNKARAAAVLKANSTYNEMVEFMNREIVFSGTVTSASGRPLAGVKVSLFGIHPVLSNAKGEYRDVFRMCELIPELGKSNNKILAAAYYSPDPAQPPKVKQLSRGLGVGFMSQKDQINSVQDRLDFVFKTDDWVKLTLRPQNVEMESEATTNLTAICRKDDGTQMDVTHEVEWHSDNNSIAVVIDGRVTAQKVKGTAHITASGKKPGQNIISKPCKVFVKFQREVEQLTIQPARLDIRSNGQAPIKAVALFNDGTVKNVTIDPECQWGSTPPNLQVTPQGKLTAGKAVWGAPDHTLKATYAFQGKTVSASIPVRLLSAKKATLLKLNPPEVVMGLNENVGLQVTALIGKGTATFPVDVTTQVIWTVSDKSIITQTAGGVIVSGGKEGYCGVKAEYRQPNGPTLKVLCKVTVVDKSRPLPAPDFSISPKDDPLPMGQPVTFRSKLPRQQNQLDLIWYVDGKEIPDQSEITHTFTSPGTYSVRLFIRDQLTGKTDAIAKNVHIQDPSAEAEVSIGFSPETNVYAIGSTVGFTAKTKNTKGITSYRWYVSGEFIDEGKSGVEHKFKKDGQYEIKLGLRMGSNFDEQKVTRTLSVGKAGIGTLGRLRNRFNAVGAPDQLEILSQYWRGGSGNWSDPIRFNGGRIGPVDHFILYDGDQADGWNTGFLIYIPKGKNQLRFKIFHFRWPSNPGMGPAPQGIVHYDGSLPLHGKTLVPDSVSFGRKASRLCIVEWRTTDGASCRARIGKFKKTNQDAMSGVKDLGCEEGVYPPIEDKVDHTEPDTPKGDGTGPDGDAAENKIAVHRWWHNGDQDWISLTEGEIPDSTMRSWGYSKKTLQFYGSKTKPSNGVAVYRWWNGDHKDWMSLAEGEISDSTMRSRGYSKKIFQFYGSATKPSNGVAVHRWWHNGDQDWISLAEGEIPDSTMHSRGYSKKTLQFYGTRSASQNETASLADRLVSGTYRVETRVSQEYDSPWTLTVQNGRIHGTSRWTCCPGPRTDSLQGAIDGNTVTITRDCTGQGYSGPCKQIYTGQLNGDVIQGTFTLNERQNFGIWTLYLDSKDDPSLTNSSQTATGTLSDGTGNAGSDKGNSETTDSEGALGGGGPGSGIVDLEGAPSGGSNAGGGAGENPNGALSISQTGIPAGTGAGQGLLGVAGNWVDKSGHRVHIFQSGVTVTATAEENKGSVGWKTAPGTMSNDVISMDFNGWQLTGKVAAMGGRITWSNASIWTRTSAANGNVDSTKYGSGALGLRWDVTEVYGWTGVWTRRSNSNIFDAHWTNGGKQEKAVLSISINGNTVTVKRKQSAGFSYPGQECIYQGILADDQVTVTGTYSCDWAAGPYTWRATITGKAQSSGDSSPPSQKIKPVITGYGRRDN